MGRNALVGGVKWLRAEVYTRKEQKVDLVSYVLNLWLQKNPLYVLTVHIIAGSFTGK